MFASVLIAFKRKHNLFCQSNSRTIFATAFKNLTASFVLAEYPPCLRAFWFPTGAPGLVPPCILHRCFPFTAGDWHSVP